MCWGLSKLDYGMVPCALVTALYPVCLHSRLQCPPLYVQCPVSSSYLAPCRRYPRDYLQYSQTVCTDPRDETGQPTKVQFVAVPFTVTECRVMQRGAMAIVNLKLEIPASHVTHGSGSAATGSAAMGTGGATSQSSNKPGPGIMIKVIHACPRCTILSSFQNDYCCTIMLLRAAVGDQRHSYLLMQGCRLRLCAKGDNTLSHQTSCSR